MNELMEYLKRLREMSPEDRHNHTGYDIEDKAILDALAAIVVAELDK